MPEREKDDVHRIDRGPVHPAVTLAAMMAGACSGRAGPITREEFERLFHGVSHPGHWAELGITMRMAALMTASALHFGSLREQADAMKSADGATDPVAAQAREHDTAVLETIRSLSALADQYGGAPAL